MTGLPDQPRYDPPTQSSDLKRDIKSHTALSEIAATRDYALRV
jgi:hypothetical protein